MSDATLFDLPAPHRKRGRARRGMEAKIRAHRAQGYEPDPAGVARLLLLCDQLDALDEILHRLGDKAKTFDRRNLVETARQIDDTDSRVFPTGSGDDPLSKALADFTAAATAQPGGLGFTE